MLGFEGCFVVFLFWVGEYGFGVLEKEEMSRDRLEGSILRKTV